MRHYVLITIFCALLLASAAMVLAIPADTDSIAEENRTITELPSLTRENVTSGNFAAEFEQYVNDHVGFRGNLTLISAALSNSAGLDSNLGKIISMDKDVGTGTTNKTRLLIKDNTIMEVFKRDINAEDKYIEVINHYAEKLPEDINFYCALVPTQLEFEEPLYSNIENSQKKTIDYIYNHTDGRAKKIDIYAALEEHKDEYIYFRTDHHWTQLGAYYAYDAFGWAAKKERVNLDDFDKNSIYNFYGSLIKEAQGTSITRSDTIQWYDVDPDGDISLEMSGLYEGDVVSYEGTLYDKGMKTVSYNYFMGGDHAFSEITNPNCPDGGTLLLLKDSYANAFIPWVAQSYNKVLVVDPRSYWQSLDAIFEEYDVDDVFLMNYIFATTFEDYCDILMDIY